MTDMHAPEVYHQGIEVEPLPLPDNVLYADPTPTAIIPHIHDYEDPCTSACPASPDYVEGFSDPAPTLQPLSTDELIENLTRQVEALTRQQESIAAMLATVVEQVGPTLDKISDNPMFKMMFGGK